MIILGVDPGLANTGWGIIEQAGTRLRCLAYGCVTTDASEGLPERLSRIHETLVAVIDRYAPAECGIESVYFGTNARSAFATGQARGVALLALAEKGLELGEYSPAQIKDAVVGVGSAEKQQVGYMVRVLLGLDHVPAPDHAADALAAAICHAHARAAARFQEAVP
ncbi:MAG: crossover junction endodeoxyribonuclease RuvC [Anaerosomatales bacterium]|nr:crossover junction endodeoxyribonuclease RuvC [Anaerosomatales bacterium]